MKIGKLPRFAYLKIEIYGGGACFCSDHRGILPVPMKKITLFLSLFFIIFVGIFFSKSVQAVPVVISNQKVIYDLPYPGLLPDHPLFFIKRIRELIAIYLAPVPLKKMELRLLYSDKQLSMAIALAQKGKQSLAGKTLLQSEEQFARIPQLMTQNQQLQIPPDLLAKIKQSNIKHKEVVETILKKGLISETDATEALNKNKENEKAIEGK